MDHAGREMIVINVFTDAHFGKDVDDLAMSEDASDRLMLRARDGNFTEKLLLKYFTGKECPSLAGKPKWINIITSQEITGPGPNDRKIATDGPEYKMGPVRLPTQANFIICHSTVRGENQK